MQVLGANNQIPVGLRKGIAEFKDGWLKRGYKIAVSEAPLTYHNDFGARKDVARQFSLPQ